MLGTIAFPVILQVLAVIVIIAEFVLPSGGMLSVAAGLLIAYSLFHAFTRLSMMTGAAFVVADLILLPLSVIVGLKLLAKSPVTLRGSLSREQGGVSQVERLEEFHGKTGRALTDLRPSGKALIGGKRVDVVTRGEYIEGEMPVEVVAVEGNQVIVRMAENNQLNS